MPEITRGKVDANGLSFEYLQAGEGPLALCLHGFPDTPFTYRHLLTELAEAGFHAVAPFIRGYAPTELPPLRSHVHSSVMVADAIALGRALGGDKDAVLVAHDWSAVAAWGALSRAPELWGRSVIINIPPFEVFGENVAKFAQIKRAFYFWFLQNNRMIIDKIQHNDFELIKDLWGEWSPGFDATEELVHVREALPTPEHIQTAISYYSANFHPEQFGSAAWAGEQEASWAGKVPQPVLYLHGTQDGCHMVTDAQLDYICDYAGPGSEASWVDGVGHFMLVEQPAAVNATVMDWLKRTAPVG
ncbi:alpha/beta hydrolase [Actinotalea sp. M2MS4P-6]|uniref:alpha/beta fold hydrolase n=1 Tax=Actinotalea sp. M2MS4P-6 TaxID=2983762 RepID=UPI0021E3B423|nr:alpha/beta hydrolase [Actinotalea sp. M2MS4P-6]MCV2395648.1 alpha/beta hydrolase [Actinotalea sp. M2MS4P-6]